MERRGFLPIPGWGSVWGTAKSHSLALLKYSTITANGQGRGRAFLAMPWAKAIATASCPHDLLPSVLERGLMEWEGKRETGYQPL